METNLFKILKNYDLDEEDIYDLLESYPGLDCLDEERIQKNISLIIQFGYPEFDLNTLILTNPTFLASNPKILAQKLNSIQGDVETALKNNPFLI